MTSIEKDELLKLTAWPERAADVTADALIVHGARLALGWTAETRVLSRRVFRMEKPDPEYEEAMHRYLDAMTAMIAEAQVTAALVAIQEVSREQANAVALRLWHYTDDGGLLEELMFDYLDQRGISSEAVWEAAQAFTASEQGEDDEAVERAHDAQVRAEALRDAADELEVVFRRGETLGGPTDEWLRKLADRIADTNQQDSAEKEQR